MAPDCDSNSTSSSIRSFDSKQASVAALQPDQADKKLTKVQSITSSLSRVRTIQTIKKVASNAREDNEITDRERKQAQKTELGRILTHADVGDALKVANDPRLEELGPLRPDDASAIRRLRSNSEVTTAFIEEGSDDNEYPPVDKGYAWVICAAEFMMVLSTWGTLTSFGVYISFWLNHDTFRGADPINYVMSSSMLSAFALILSPPAMICFNLVGFKLTATFGLIMYFLGFLLCSFSTRLWQLYLTQGVMVGTGFAFISNPCIVMLSGWFVKYRAFSSGVVNSGAGAGGVIFSLASQALISRTGNYRWAIRMVSLVTFVLNVLVVILVRERVPVKRECSWKEFRRQSKIILDLNTMKHWHVVYIALWFAFGFTSYLVLNYTLSSFATFIGLSQQDGSNVTAIFNGCQIVGRLIIGILADKCGRVNIGVVMNFVIVIVIFGFFLEVTNYATLVSFSVVSGLLTGWTQVLSQAIMPDAVPMSEFASVWSYINILLGGFSLYGPISALKLRDLSAEKPFIKAQLFSGALVCASTVFIILVREWKVGFTIRKRLGDAKEDLNLEDSEKSSDMDSQPVLEARIRRYEELLKPGVFAYLRRLFYPLKV